MPETNTERPRLSPLLVEQVRAGIEQIRLRLLDLTGRNRLISFRHTKSTLRAVDADLERVHAALIAGKQLAFMPVPEPTKMELAAYGEKPSAREYAEAPGWNVNFDLQQNIGHSDGLPILHYKEDFDVLIRKIGSTAKTAIEESGGTTTGSQTSSETGSSLRKTKEIIVSRVSHFQRFSQPENHATNNTLLLLRYFYQSSPFKIEQVLTSLLEKDISIGLTFEQQIKGNASVPDALISQEPMRIYIETKRGGDLDSGQIRRHFESISAHPAASSYSDGTILIGLTKEPISEPDRKALTEAGALHGIIFGAVTFTQIIEALRAGCADFERELLSIVEDYERYVADQHLLEERSQKLVVFPCGVSVTENERFNLYYESPSRPCKRNHRFIGVYKLKTIAFVGIVETIVIATYDKGKITFEVEAGVLRDDQKKRIRDTIEQTPYYDLKANPHRYYVHSATASVQELRPSALRSELAFHALRVVG